MAGGGGGGSPLLPPLSSAPPLLVSGSPEVEELVAAAENGSIPSLRSLIADEGRNAMLTAEWNGVVLDATRQKIDAATQKRLLALSKSSKVAEAIARMFRGDKINETEGRAVLHVALRSRPDDVFLVDEKNIVPEVHSVLNAIRSFAEDIRSGKVVGATGKPLRDVVCIGIGGSYLGSEFLLEALRTDSTASRGAEGRRLRFLANVDPVDVRRATDGLNAETTLVVIVSKTFTTAETMLNARTMKQWLTDGLKGAAAEASLGLHLCAVSTNLSATAAFGIDPSRVFGFWDWVGGRFSVTSAVGVVPLTLHFGWAVVEKLLEGCRAMDEHFRTAPAEKNLPLLMALHSTWNSNFLKLSNVAVLPYSQALHRFAAHVQQLTMESNGKGVAMDGSRLPGPAGEIFFGEPGTNGQHSFYQLLHQGRVVPAEFIGFSKSQNPLVLPGEDVSSHDELMSNFFAQPDALAFGKSADEVKASGVAPALVPHKTFPGDRPSTVLLFPSLDAYYLGTLLALYEHRTAAQGFLWGLNSFDQWGVELGKVLAKDVKGWLKEARNGTPPESDGFCGPTRRLLQRYIASG